MNYENLRISKLRAYMLTMIDELLNSTDYQINVDMLDNEPENFSLDKIPTASTVEKWIDGTETHRDVYNFRSRKAYSQDTINNLKNIGFFEQLEDKINSNNKKGILPDIEGIENIKCLNSGTMNRADTQTAEFDIQIQVIYKKYYDVNILSL